MLPMNCNWRKWSYLQNNCVNICIIFSRKYSTSLFSHCGPVSCCVTALTNLFLLCFRRAKSSTFIPSTAPTTHGRKAAAGVYLWVTDYSVQQPTVQLLSQPNLTSTCRLPSVSHGFIVHYLFLPSWRADMLYGALLSRSQNVYRQLCLRVSLPPLMLLVPVFFLHSFIPTAFMLTDGVLKLSPYHT